MKTHRLKLAFALLVAFSLVAGSIPSTAFAATNCVAYYTVKEGDTTPKISHTFGLKWREIAAAWAMDRVEAQLLVVGDGCQRGTLEQLCTDLGIRLRAHFLGYIDQEGDLPALHRQATVFATASEIETQGLVVLEALACGVPVVAVRATCLHESVQDGINGFLVQPGAIDEMAARLVELLSHPGRADQMGRTGRDLMGRHSIHYTAQAYERLYQDLIQNNLPGVCQPGVFQSERSRKAGLDDFL